MNDFKNIAVPSFLAEFTTFPIDTLRAKYQGKEIFVNSSSYRKVLHQLYSGLGLAMIRQCSVSILKLSFMSGLDPFVKNEFISGWVSGAIATSMINPLDVLKNHRQTATSYPSKRVPVIYREIMNAHGVGGFMHGLKSNILRGSIISACEYGSYFYLKRHYGNWLPVYASGAIAGGITAIVVHPIDRIRNKVHYAANRIEALPKHPWSFNEYYSGFRYALPRRVIFNAIFFTAWELIA